MISFTYSLSSGGWVLLPCILQHNSQQLMVGFFWVLFQRTNLKMIKKQLRNLF